MYNYIYIYGFIMIYSACELLPTCNKLENPGVRKSHYSSSDKSWRTWKVTPRYGLHIISLWTLLGHIRIYHCALQIEHKRTTQKNSMEHDQVPLEPASIYCNHISSTCSTLITAWHESTVFLFGTYAHPYFESWTCRHLWLPPFCPMEARPNRLSRHPGKRQGRHAIILQ